MTKKRQFRIKTRQKSGENVKTALNYQARKCCWLVAAPFFAFAVAHYSPPCLNWSKKNKRRHRD